MERPVVLYRDTSIIVLNKPAGWVVHPGAGTENGELVTDWLVKNYPEITYAAWPDINRIGIVHRLDKDTSGVMVTALTPKVLQNLQAQFKARTVKKVYQAIVWGVPQPPKGNIQTLIGRHPKHRQEQTVLSLASMAQTAREAITHYHVVRELVLIKEKCSLIQFEPLTGRMHQLRVHAKYIGHPILGDPVYTIKPAKRLAKELGIGRQMLHAQNLTLHHPENEKEIQFTAPLWSDMQKYLK